MTKDCYFKVSHSLKGMSWRFALNDAQRARALGLEQKFGFTSELAQLLISRNVEDDMVEDYLSPTLRVYMVDPLSFVDMDKAANRIIKAIEHKEAITIYGDYDVDGACCCALLTKFLRFFSIEPRIYIPDRIAEGYGPNPEAMKMLIDEGANLIITVDCGANSLSSLALAKQKNIDIVVIDHHQMSDTHDLAYALVNPNRPDDLSGQGHLCGAGVLFMTLVEICRRLRQKGKDVPDLLRYLDLVAFATVCDVMPLIGINRAFVTQGLKVASKGGNCGLEALIDCANISVPLQAFHFGFILGPRVNAGGRIGDQVLGARLLATENPEEALHIARQLSKLNEERQKLERYQLEEAEGFLTFHHDGALDPIIVVGHKNWHPGIVGLLAARLKEKYQRPAIVFAIKENGFATGSCRSIPGFDIGGAIRKAQEEGFLVSGGGHNMAAGATIAEDQITAFASMLNENYGSLIIELLKKRELLVDGALSPQAVTAEFYREINQLGPYGPGNETPIFVIPHVDLKDCRVVGSNHLQLSFKGQAGDTIKAVAFNEADSALGLAFRKNYGNRFHIAGTISLNYWKGRITPQMHIKDAALVSGSQV